MTMVTYTSVVAHTTDAEFRAWGQELSTNLAASGLVQTADTGQINWTTVTRPGTGVAAGYEIWRFADSSIYLKIEYGTGNTATATSVWISVATGSNGSGTLTPAGLTTTRTAFFNNTVPSAITPYTTYIYRSADCVTVVFKNGSLGSGVASGPIWLFVIGKSVDVTGAATTTGYSVLTCVYGGNLLVQSVRTVSPAILYTQRSYGFTAIPNDPVSSVVGADAQAYLFWIGLPQAQPWPWAFVYVAGDIGRFITVSAALVGSTPHNYFTLGTVNGGSVLVSGYSSGNISLAVMME